MNLKDLKNEWINELTQPLMIAGPCSAESEAQMLETARRIKESNAQVSVFRAGIWKPRTKPNGFEGVGVIGLNWLKKVKEEYGFKTATEVANAHHVFAALEADVDVLWIGARSTVNPFTVQEIAMALRGTDKPSTEDFLLTKKQNTEITPTGRLLLISKASSPISQC